MTKECLFAALGEIDDGLVTEALTLEESRVRRSHALRGMTAAAVLLLVCAGVLTGAMAHRTLSQKNSEGGEDSLLPSFLWRENTNLAPAMSVTEFRGAYYEILNMSNTETLDRHGLPRRITESMVGRQVAEVRDDSGKPFTLYECLTYETVRQQAVYVAAESTGKETRYTYALFCNNLHTDTGAYDTAEDMLAIIGVYGREDILSVEVGKRQLTSGEITRFYDLLCGAQAMGEDGYQRAVFGGLSEREQQALSIELADSAVELRIGVRGGFYACGLTYEPDIGWIDWATNHYRLSESLPV